MSLDDVDVLDLFAGPCWVGVGTDNGDGYHTVRAGGRNRYLHRLSYQAHVGPVPRGLVLDHLCRNRACFNPDHLEPVTNAENILRGQSPPARNARKDRCSGCGGEYVRHKEGRRCLSCKQERRADTKEKGIGRPGDRTHCRHGHPFDAENTRIILRPDGSFKQRQCKTCGRENVRARRQKEVVPA